MTYHHGGMGNEAETQTGTWRGPGPNPFTSGAAPTGADMPIREVQLRLIRAGKAIAADGVWGAKTRGALESFARSRGIALPSFGTRGDYKLMGDKVRVPVALAMALPAPASGAGVRPRSQRRTATPSVPSTAPPSEAAPPSFAPPGTDSGADSGGDAGAPWYQSEALKKAAPWAILALGGAAAVFVWSRRRKPTSSAAAPA